MHTKSSDETEKHFQHDGKMLTVDRVEVITTLNEDENTERSLSECDNTIVADKEDEQLEQKDGGYGWVIVFAASLSAFTAFSTMQSW
ncbi:hypothetical protein INT45_011041 [Circinella minor]|uniref:Uncharacterized protein n=1 Tax=Circinella minor TaxID=1195481 RepID=A0A8H7VV48_9FUNG|nr:hypothetical protein INT45_011041 [Circinella minor]